MMGKIPLSRITKPGVTLKNHKGKQLTKNGKITQETKEDINRLVAQKKAREDSRRISSEDLNRMINL